MRPPDIDPFACIDQVSVYLSISYSAVRRQIAIGALPAMRIGRCIRIKWTDVYAFVETHMMNPVVDDLEDEDALDGEDEFEDDDELESEDDLNVVDLGVWKAVHPAGSRRHQ